MPSTREVLDNFWPSHAGDFIQSLEKNESALEEQVDTEEPLVVSRFSDGSKTIESISHVIDNPMVVAVSDTVMRDSMLLLAHHAGSFNDIGSEYDIDPIILVTLVGYELGGSLDEPRKHIESAARKFQNARASLKSEDAAVMAHSLGVAQTISAVQGNTPLDEEAKLHWPVVVLTHERLQQKLKA